jgi:hypothetical protein
VHRLRRTKVLSVGSSRTLERQETPFAPKKRGKSPAKPRKKTEARR